MRRLQFFSVISTVLYCLYLHIFCNQLTAHFIKKYYAFCIYVSNVQVFKTQSPFQYLVFSENSNGFCFVYFISFDRNSHSLSENPDSPCNHSGSQVQEDVFIQGPSQFDTTYSILHQIQVLEKSSYKVYNMTAFITPYLGRILQYNRLLQLKSVT